jgi:hypothetical protein
LMPSLDISFSRICLDFWLVSSFFQLLSPPQAVTMLINCFCLFLTNSSKEKTLHTEWLQNQIRDKPCGWVFQETTRQVK